MATVQDRSTCGPTPPGWGCEYEYDVTLDVPAGHCALFRLGGTGLVRACNEHASGVRSFATTLPGDSVGYVEHAPGRGTFSGWTGVRVLELCIHAADAPSACTRGGDDTMRWTHADDPPRRPPESDPTFAPEHETRAQAHAWTGPTWDRASACAERAQETQAPGPRRAIPLTPERAPRGAPDAAAALEARGCGCDDLLTPSPVGGTPRTCRAPTLP